MNDLKDNNIAKVCAEVEIILKDITSKKANPNAPRIIYLTESGHDSMNMGKYQQNTITDLFLEVKTGTIIERVTQKPTPLMFNQDVSSITSEQSYDKVVSLSNISNCSTYKRLTTEKAVKRLGNIRSTYFTEKTEL